MDEQIVQYEAQEGSLFALLDESAQYRAIAIAVLIVIALVSFFVAGSYFSQPEAFSKTIASLDAKKADVTALVAASTAASAAITVIPGDAGTPIAEKLVDLSSDFIIVLTAIYLEKYLLTTLGFAAFKVLIPLSCLLVVIALLARKYMGARAGLTRLAAKLALFAVVSVIVVPVSVSVSNMIETTYADSMNATIEAAKQTAEDAQGDAQSTANSSDVSNQTASEEGFLQGLIGQIQQLPQQVSQGVDGLTQEVQATLNSFIEAFAIMIVTSCVIPILVLVFFLWIMKLTLGIDTQPTRQVLYPRGIRAGLHRR